MIYRVTVDTHGPVIYDVPSDIAKSKEEAINFAEQWFSEYLPEYTVEEVEGEKDKE